uniref:CST complex subunit CTC1 n=1 Tax=Cuerna arida TaxID=1464854 RepID=A0A1B6FEU2_9HEMI
MAGVLKSNVNVQQEVQEIFLTMGPVASKNGIVDARHQARLLEGVGGVVRLAAAPHYGLTLDTGSAEEPYTVPLILVDTAKHLPQWISIVGQQVWIHKLLVVCELFQVQEKNYELQCVNALVIWDDIRVLNHTVEGNPVVQLSEKHSSSILSQDTSTNPERKDSNVSRVMVHHVSTVFYVVSENLAHCLVFLSYTNCKQLEVKLWVVLKAEQVAWREFLVPNREYVIEFPPGTEKYYFDKSHKPLDNVFRLPNKELGVIFHHKTLFSTLNGCELPVGSKVFLSSNTQFSKFVCQFTKDPYSNWYSASEAEHANIDLVTLYGVVDSILYNEDVVFKSCNLCIRAKPSEPILTESKLTINQPWTNPWMSELSFEAEGLLELPNVEENKLIMRTGVPGNMVQIIKLRDVVTGSEHSVYVKHNYHPQSQQLFRLSPGVVLCITHLNRRCSNTGKYYFITTVLSNFRVLSYQDSEKSSESWGLYGLCHTSPNNKDKIWGVLEALNISKIAITARCSYCNAEFSQNSCSRECAVPDQFTTSAYAIAKLQIIHNGERIRMEKVLIKDKLVPKLLCIPPNIWQMCLTAAAEEEIICFVHSRPTTGSLQPLDFNALFKMYCKAPKKNGKFYISVRKMTSLSSTEPFYFCIQLEPIDKYRLNIVAELAKKSLKMQTGTYGQSN